MMGKAIYSGSDVFCPVSTSSPIATGDDHEPELRAYKLGKQKCSFNQVELIVNDIENGRMTGMRISHAVESPVGPEVDEVLRESCLKFNVGFMNKKRMHLYVYLVYASAHRISQIGNHSLSSPHAYHWIPVTRGKCRKGCKGPVIRGLQRFGRMPRRKAEGSSSSDEDSWKQPHHLYIAIDEASGHHNGSNFRLLLAAYGERNELLGTTVSNSIRVFANNDAPLGPACFDIHFNIKGGWDGSESPVAIGTYDKYVNCRPPLQGGSSTDTSESLIGDEPYNKFVICRPPLQDTFADENIDVNMRFFPPPKKRGYRPLREQSSSEAAAGCEPLLHPFPVLLRSQSTSAHHGQTSKLEQAVSYHQYEIPDESSDEAVAVDVLKNWLIAASSCSSSGHSSDCYTHTSLKSPAHVSEKGSSLEEF
ncbi:hypothetical protein R1sor_016600 [Riccia sorocarpa]|uniref:Uncharacterized protein n=1 Tax=Riccia sorocarpa TaxID=122646 RepID=A0ABD3HHG1_9MARC